MPPKHTVWLAGEPVPVDENGNFEAETILPAGTHTVEVALLDEEGNGELYLRDLELEKEDWFYAATADLTLSPGGGGKAARELAGANAPVDLDSPADGRVAFYLDGKFAETWKLRASADTQEGPVGDLFSNFMDKSPESLFRRIDPDYYYPTYGDDGTVEQLAPTSGKFFAKLSNHDNHALFGNFKVGYLDNELAHVDRALYGGNLHYETDSTTSFGEKRAALDGFGAEPGTVPSREEFRGTGGSAYFLRQHDILTGSERVRIETRDRDSGLVTSVVQLQPSVDYDIDYFQGRVLLSEPLTSTGAGNSLLVRDGSVTGDEAWLVVQYEYTPGFDKLNTIAAGGQGHYWFGDYLKLGLTANSDVEGEGDSKLYGGDMTLRATGDSWLKVQTGKREGLLSSWASSDDGGFGFQDPSALGLTEADADAYRADLSVGVGDLFAGAPGRVNLYGQKLGGGYSTASLTALTDTTAVRRHSQDSADGQPHAGREGGQAEPDRWAPDAGWRARPGLPAHRPLEPRRRGPERAATGRLPDRSRDPGGGRPHRRHDAARLRLESPLAQLRLRAEHAGEERRHGRQRARRHRRRVSLHRSLPGRCRGLLRPAGPGGQARDDLPGDRPHEPLPELRPRRRARRRRDCTRAAEVSPAVPGRASRTARACTSKRNTRRWTRGAA